MTTLDFTLNGKPVSVEVKANQFLAEVLRYKLGLTGTKVGCNEAECGICTVIIDGQSINSCIYPALRAQGRHIETIEGLANGHLHALQENFIKYGAVQCGFCTPGLIMQAKALLDKKNGQPITEEEIKIALKDTYCRCTGYVAVKNAIKAANGQDVSLEEYLPETKHGYEVVGEALPRAVAATAPAAPGTAGAGPAGRALESIGEGLLTTDVVTKLTLKKEKNKGIGLISWLIHKQHN